MIGFFDSGMGGLTILDAVKKRLPEIQTTYLADTEHAPYGGRSQEEILELTWHGCEELFRRGCDLIILACNTASASALRTIQQERLGKYPGKRVLGIIRPTVEALAHRGYARVIVLSTQATKDSGAFVKEFAHLDPDVQVISHACPTWVPLIEAGKTGTEEMRSEVEREVRSAEQEAGTFDAIILGCTHYPYVKKEIGQSLTRRVPIIDQADIVAESLAAYLKRHPAFT
ncbi:glutamate racemase [Candidatus Uhrbacteria bacterium]|nr:glutamate racemase [Candidatus Uhrbacteria bacterium]